MSEHKFRPGSAWVEPKLYRFRGSPTSHEIVVLRPWPDPRAWRRTSGGVGWWGCRPPIDLRRADRPLRKKATHGARHERAAAMQVPSPIRSAVGPLPQWTQWAVLAMVARVDGALDLLQASPALAVGLAHSFALRPTQRRPIRAARVQVRRRRRQIAGWLGFPETEASVKAIARLHPDDRTPQGLTALRCLLLAGEPWLAHLNPITAEALALLIIQGPRRDRLTLGLLQEIGAIRSATGRDRAYGAVYRALNDGGEPRGRAGSPVLRSVEAAQQFLDEVCAQERQQWIAALRAEGPFPAPPYADALIDGPTPWRMSAISDAGSLVDHAARQRNCLDSDTYFRRILDGTGYAYELSWTAGSRTRRATLYLDARGVLRRRWGMEDLRLSCNRPAPDWLAEQVIGLLKRVAPARLPAPRVVPEVASVDAVLDDRQIVIPF